MPCSADTDSQVTFRRLSAVDRCIASLTVGVFGQYAACRIEGLHFFLLLCRIAILLFLFCIRLFDLRLCLVHLVFLYLCLDLWFFFSLCERIFLCGLRSFALARATKRTKLKSKPSIALWNPAALERLANFLASGVGLVVWHT